MSLVALQGGSHAEADKERLLDEIRRIIDKPIVI